MAIVVALFIFAVSLCVSAYAFKKSSLSLSTLSRNILYLTEEESESKELTEVGSQEYYKGFIQSSLKDDSVDRGDGLDQALKLGLYTGGILILLVVAFLSSNGLL